MTARATIYVLDASVDCTGAFVAATHMATALRDMADVVLVLPNGSAIPANRTHDFSRVEYVPITRLSKRLRELVAYLPNLIRGVWKLRRLMRRDGSACLLINDFYLMHGVGMRLLGYRGSIVQWVRCHPRRFAGPLAPWMLRLVSATADRVVGVSHHVLSLLPATMNAELLYDYSRVQPRAPKSWTIEAIKPFVYVGHYIPGKGQDVALEAFAIAAAKNPSLRLLFYGGCMGLAKNRAYKAGLEARSRALGLEDRVAFHDAVTESHSVLAFAYAALNFSASESFSMTVLEASGSGVPVLATRSGGPQEIIVDGSTGYLVPVGDIEAAAAGMERLASTPELAETMGASAARHVAERFNEEAFRHRLHALVA